MTLVSYVGYITGNSWHSEDYMLIPSIIYLAAFFWIAFDWIKLVKKRSIAK
jgi:hypothetical protein